MLITITVNGSEGVRFLTSLGPHGPLPAALTAMIEQVTTARNDHVALEVEVEVALADQIADIVDELVRAGVGDARQPLLFSPQIGDRVIIVRDSLVEMHVSKHELRTWRYLAGGTRGRVVARRGDTAKVVLRDGAEAGEHAYISDRCMTRHRRNDRS